MPETAYPFQAFNFSIEINVPSVSSQVCNASFSECDGLEMSMEVKTIREGGNNGSQIRLTGPLSYGNATLRRGMTASFDLWKWFTQMLINPLLRADAEIVMLAADKSEQVRFRLSRCVPIKLKAPSLNATTGVVAIEELQLAYETLTLVPPGGSGGGGSGSGGASGGFSGGISGGISGGLSAGITGGLSANLSGGISGGISGGASAGLSIP